MFSLGACAVLYLVSGNLLGPEPPGAGQSLPQQARKTFPPLATPELPHVALVGGKGEQAERTTLFVEPTTSEPQSTSAKDLKTRELAALSGLDLQAALAQRERFEVMKELVPEDALRRIDHKLKSRYWEVLEEQKQGEKQKEDGGKGAEPIVKPVSPIPPPGGSKGDVESKKQTADAKKEPAGDKAGDKKGEEKAGDKKGDERRLFFVREYVHEQLKDVQVFQDTVLWQPALLAIDGTARIEFDLSIQPTTYRIHLYGHTSSGRLGAFQGKIHAR
jgi:hypothetical protein